MAAKCKRNKAPSHLSKQAGAWWESVVMRYECSPHHIHLLTLAAEALDRCAQARRAIKQHGLVFVNSYGNPQPRPEVAIERDARVGFARLLRELNLPGEEVPPERGKYS